MFKSILSLLLLWPVVLSLKAPAKAMPLAIATQECPGATSLRVTNQTSSTLSLAWNSSGEPTQFKAWYVRQSDGSTSGYFYTSSNNYQFTGLGAGHYNFYVAAMCGTISGPAIGIEDIVIG